jgi:hypothetical protein
MRKIAVAALSLVLLVCASPAFARHKKPHKDPRITEHSKVSHQKNQHLRQVQKHKVPKHNTNK